MNHGIKHQSSGRGSKHIIAGILFLVLFASANLLILFMNSNPFSSLKITAYDASLIDTLLFIIYVMVAAGSIYYTFNSESWTSKLIFIVLLIYSAGRLIYSFNFLK